jgi:hypothetical protein
MPTSSDLDCAAGGSLSPYVTLPLQGLAVIVGALALALLVPRTPLKVAIATAAAVLITVVTAQQLWSSTISYDSGRTQLALAPGVSEREMCALEGGHPDLVAFSRWLDERVPSDARIAYVTRSFDRPCFQFSLLPRRMVGDVADAGYVMYLDPPDEDVRRRLRAERRKPVAERDIEFYSPWWALERKS